VHLLTVWGERQPATLLVAGVPAADVDTALAGFARLVGQLPEGERVLSVGSGELRRVRWREHLGGDLPHGTLAGLPYSRITEALDATPGGRSPAEFLRGLTSRLVTRS
jgi:hypothetical protein